MPLQDCSDKIEKINGVLYNMSPSAGFDHANVNGNIYGCLFGQLRNSLCRVYIENADLYLDENSEDYVIPDIMVVCDTKAFRKHTRKYYGVPKFVVETLSPSTAHKDRTVKKEFYAKKGVREYWIIDHRSKSLEIYYLEEKEYQLVETFLLESNPEEEAYNAKKVIHLREFPNVFFVLEEIFKDVGND